MDEEYESDTEGVAEGVGSSTPFTKRSKRRSKLGGMHRAQFSLRTNAQSQPIVSWDRDGQGISSTSTRSGPPGYGNNSIGAGASLYRDLDSRDNRLLSRLRRFLFS